MRTHVIWTTLSLALIAACGRGKDQTQATDTAGRDLSLAPVDTTAGVGDRPAPTPEAPATTPPPSTPKPKPAPSRPTTPAPAPSRVRSLPAGATVTGTTSAEIHSGKNKVGDIINVAVAEDIKDAGGRVVIPAGSTVALRIDKIKWSENKSDPDGTLAVTATSVTIGGESYPLDGAVAKLDRQMVNRGGALGDASKVAAGAGIGAVAGRIIGGNKTGTIIGGIVGGAVGTQRAIETKDRDVVVASGTPVTITLNSTFTKS